MPVSPSGRFASNGTKIALASPSKALLSGRNCVLASHLFTTFTAILSLDDNRAVLCSDQGDVGLVENGDRSPIFRKVTNAGFAINAVSRVSNDIVLVAGQQLKRYDLKELLNASVDPNLDSIVNERNAESLPATTNIVALGVIGEHQITVDSHRVIQLLSLQYGRENELHDVASAIRLPAHGSAVLGVEPFASKNLPEASFLTFSADGSFLFWTMRGTLVMQMQVCIDHSEDSDDSRRNIVTAAKACQSHDTVIVGGTSGSVK